MAFISGSREIYFAGLVLLQVSATFFTDCTVNGVAAAAPAAFDEDAWSDD